MTTAGPIADHVSGASNKFFTVEDFGGPRPAVARALSRLEARRELVRVKRGLYWRGTKTPLGMAPPSSEEILDRVYGKGSGVGPARHDAARHLGLTTQIPRRPTYAVPYDVEGLPVALVNRARRTGRVRLGLTPSEVAVLEVLDAWDDVVELPPTEAVRRLMSLMGSAVRPEALADAGGTEPARVRERLRAILESGGCGEAARRIPPAANPATRQTALRHLPAPVVTT